MKKIMTVILSFISSSLWAAPANYGAALCAYPMYQCVKAGGGGWEKMFPDEVERDIVQRINRTYNYLWAGKVIAVPKNMAGKTLLDFSPFPLKIKSEGEKQVIVDQDKLAYGAYDENGNLVKWGPVASGADKCSDNSAKTCRTLTGIFRVFSEEGPRCVSNVFPIGKGGAKMPYCMYFHKGFAMHGSADIPGYRASHGCVRMFTQDAKWLNLEFVQSSNADLNRLGTKVTVRPVTQSGVKK